MATWHSFGFNVAIANVTSPLSTQKVAEFMVSKSSIAGSLFTFVVESPAFEERYFRFLSLNKVSYCSYPGPKFSKEFLTSECQDTFSSSFEQDFQVLSGKLHLSVVDSIGTFRGRPIERDSRSVLSINLRLPTTISLNTTSLNILAPIDALIAVTFQEYDYDTDTATLELTTSVQWPYQLSNPDLVSALSPAFNVSLLHEDLSCEQDNVGSPCQQVTTLIISEIRTRGRACSFDGDYVAEWQFSCRSGLQPSLCALPDVPSLSANFTLASGDICGTFGIDSSLSGQLLSFRNGFLQEAVSFLAGERIYLQASLSAQVEILSVSLRTLVLKQEGEEKPLVENGTPVSPFNSTIAFQEGGGGANQVSFSFLASMGGSPSDLFGTGASVFSFSVEALLEVAYVTSFGRKRDLLQESFSLAAHMVLLREN